MLIPESDGFHYSSVLFPICPHMQFASPSANSFSSFLSTSPYSNNFWLDCSCAVLRLVAQSCPTLCDLRDCSPPGSSVHGDFPSKSKGVGCHALLQGIFQTQGSNLSLLGFLHWQVHSLPLVPPGKSDVLCPKLLGHLIYV